MKCPCYGCTAETGRGPGCHNEDCPRGWAAWDRAHKQEHAADLERRAIETAADNARVSAAAKRLKERRRKERR